MEEFRVLDYKALDTELRQYAVALIDPSEFHTSKTNKKLVRIQGYKDRVIGMMFDAINNKNIAEKRYNEMLFEIDREKERLMINDVDIKDLAQKKAEAATNLKLADRLANLLLIENILSDAKSYEARVRIAYENLEATYKSISKLIGNVNIMFMRGEIKVKQGTGGLKIEEE